MINKRLGSYALQVIHNFNPACCAGMVLCMVSFAWWPMLPVVQLLTAPLTIFKLVVIVIGCLVILSLTLSLRLLLRPVSNAAHHDINRRHKLRHFITGAIIACVYCNWIGHQYIYAINSIEFDTPLWVQGEVTTLQNTDHRLSKKSTVVLRVTHINSDEVSPMLIRVNWYYPKANLRQGQHWQLLVKLKPTRGLANQAGFDYQRYLIGQHIVATGYIKPHVNNHWSSG
jgi:hypothetical protein